MCLKEKQKLEGITNGGNVQGRKELIRENTQHFKALYNETFGTLKKDLGIRYIQGKIGYRSAKGVSQQYNSKTKQKVAWSLCSFEHYTAHSSTGGQNDPGFFMLYAMYPMVPLWPPHTLCTCPFSECLPWCPRFASTKPPLTLYIVLMVLA